MKNKVIRSCVDEAVIEQLEFLKQKTGKTSSDLIRKGIEKLYQEMEREEWT
ncbi:MULTISPECIES: hypothetical protein [unclassified Streptococcus]|uniref:hypothetical protein n=1 Tax=unclassified Streptococcus TaxID=2608887 RepID=UPI00211B1A47|nr:MULTISPECIES: hypothetical protein [unclassified Streptococcus]MCQ9211817.1 hypothetical protein [Streptococcus sp. B01]MCQ9212847.1 hypothetical protein [Streptococcus sp. B01]MCQ9212936.1 hypothetical protein [Streptococcus sp. O1]MCQ9215014.1 hypothetical protein [Streptococcus sp. O1]